MGLKEIAVQACQAADLAGAAYDRYCFSSVGGAFDAAHADALAIAAAQAFDIASAAGIAAGSSGAYDSQQAADFYGCAGAYK